MTPEQWRQHLHAGADVLRRVLPRPMVNVTIREATNGRPGDTVYHVRLSASFHRGRGREWIELESHGPGLPLRVWPGIDRRVDILIETLDDWESFALAVAEALPGEALALYLERRGDAG